VEADEPDMNRVWGGSLTWMANLLVGALDPYVRGCDAIIDYHPSGWGIAMTNTWWSEDLPDPEVSARSRDLSIAFGTSVQSRRGLKHPGSGTLAAYAGVHLGIPTISGGLGGSGFGTSLEQTWDDLAVQGVLNVMACLGMHQGPMRLPEQQLHFSRTVRVHPSVGGLLMPEREPTEEQNPRVEQGEILGRVVCPYTYETLEVLVAPSAGWLYWWPRSYPVRPGCFAFGFATEDSAEWITHG
jgi:predicted deacylase